MDNVQHQNLSETEIRTGLTYLSELLYEHFNLKVYVLIDDYDAFVSKAMCNKHLSNDDLKDVMIFIDNIIFSLLGDNEYVCRGLLNVCHDITCSLWNYYINGYIKHYHSLSKEFCEFYGFIAEEVEYLLQKHNLINVQIKKVKEWYNGSSLLDRYHRHIEIYSNWSILNYLNKEIETYWFADKLRKIKNALCHDKIRNIIKNLMDRNDVYIKYKEQLTLDDMESLRQMILSPPSNIEEQDLELFVQFLYENSFLSVKTRCNEWLMLKIPNFKIYNEFCKALFSIDFFKIFYKHYSYDEDSIQKLFKKY
jgi:hypothetical protein